MKFIATIKLNQIHFKDFISLRDHPDFVVLDGLNVVKKYRKFCGKLQKIFLTPEYLEEHPALNDEEFSNQVETISKNEMSLVVGYKYHRGVIGVGERPQFQDISKIVGNTFILNGVAQAENIGSICRSLAAFNINNLIIDSKSCHPYIRRAIRVSMGNVFKLNIFKLENLFETIDFLQQNSYQVLAADYRDKAVSLSEAKIGSPTAIIIGSEGHGIDPEVYGKVDQLIKIDVDPEVEYLNASVASSVLAFWLTQNYK